MIRQREAEVAAQCREQAAASGQLACARIVQRLLALNACIWHNWMIGAPVKRSLIAYDH